MGACFAHGPHAMAESGARPPLLARCLLWRFVTAPTRLRVGRSLNRVPMSRTPKGKRGAPGQRAFSALKSTANSSWVCHALRAPIVDAANPPSPDTHGTSPRCSLDAPYLCRSTPRGGLSWTEVVPNAAAGIAPLSKSSRIRSTSADISRCRAGLGNKWPKSIQHRRKSDQARRGQFCQMSNESGRHPTKFVHMMPGIGLIWPPILGNHVQVRQMCARNRPCLSR